MSSNGNRPLVLIIDDEESIRDSCSQVLNKEGYQVEIAPDGRTGLGMVKDIKPDLVLVDLKMPGMSGQEVLEELSRIDPFMAKVVVTGYATVSSAVESMKQGACDFLPKPFIPDELRIAVRRALERSRLLKERELLKREKEEMKSYFISVITHEVEKSLKTLLELMARLEPEKTKAPEDLKESMDKSRKEIQNLSDLLEKWKGTLA
jgi:DNA-binding NtrC family response regulator